MKVRSRRVKQEERKKDGLEESLETVKQVKKESFKGGRRRHEKSR